MRNKSEEIVVNTFNDHPIAQRVSDGYLDGVAMCRAVHDSSMHYFSDSNTFDFLEAICNDVPNAKELYDMLVAAYKPGNNRPLPGVLWLHPTIAIHLAYTISPKFANCVVNWVAKATTPSLTTAVNRLTDVVSRLAAYRHDEPEKDRSFNPRKYIDGVEIPEHFYDRPDYIDSTSTVAMSAWMNALVKWVSMRYGTNPHTLYRIIYNTYSNTYNWNVWYNHESYIRRNPNRNIVEMLGHLGRLKDACTVAYNLFGNGQQPILIEETSVRGKLNLIPMGHQSTATSMATVGKSRTTKSSRSSVTKTLSNKAKRILGNLSTKRGKRTRKLEKMLDDLPITAEVN